MSVFREPLNPPNHIRTKIVQAASIVLHIDRETNLHIEYCRKFGIEKADMENAVEHVGT